MNQNSGSEINATTVLFPVAETGRLRAFAASDFPRPGPLGIIGFDGVFRILQAFVVRAFARAVLVHNSGRPDAGKIPFKRTDSTGWIQGAIPLIHYDFCIKCLLRHHRLTCATQDQRCSEFHTCPRPASPATKPPHSCSRNSAPTSRRCSPASFAASSAF